MSEEKVLEVSTDESVSEALRKHTGNVAHYVADQILREALRIRRGWTPVESMENALDRIEGEARKALTDLKERGVIQ